MATLARSRTSVGPPPYEITPDYVVVAKPAAGATASYVNRTQQAVRVIGAEATLTTSATTANRFVSLDYIDPLGTQWMRNGAGLVVTASTTNQAFVWSANRAVGEWAANTPVFVPVLPLWLPTGWQIKFAVDAIDTTDQLASLSLVLEIMTD